MNKALCSIFIQLCNVNSQKASFVLYVVCFVFAQRYREAEYNVFNIDETDPWRHKWVPDVGRIPARKPSVSLRSFGHHEGWFS